MISLPSDIDLADREWLISEGCRCPVCSSVNEKMEVEIRFSD
jgi:hypothetical protein